MRRAAPLLLAAAGAASAATQRFLAIGDWGGDSDKKPTTKAELHNSVGMAKVAGDGGAAFVMALGDNFYDDGIDDGKGAESPRFEKTWGSVFTQKELQVPWYVVAGNHDHDGDVDAQVKYAAKSDLWHFPSLWYTFSHSFESAGGRNVTTQVVYIDTIVLDGMSYRTPNGTIVNSQPHPMQAHASTQLQWLEDTLKASTADYLWVSGHYPVYSICEHGPTYALIQKVLPLMKKYRATGYISGHDHCQEQFTSDGMAFVVSGAGMECCYSPGQKGSYYNKAADLLFHMDDENDYGADGGFASFTVTDSATVVRHHDSSGKELYVSPAIPPRSAAPVPPGPAPGPSPKPPSPGPAPKPPSPGPAPKPPSPGPAPKCKDTYKYTCQQSWCVEKYWQGQCEKTCSLCPPAH